MAVLTDRTEILELDTVNPRDGVKFSSTHYRASTVTIDVTRWIDMGSPRRVVVTVTPARPEPPTEP